jgi:hypothetical protein
VKLTNKYNLPEPFVLAVQGDQEEYDDGGYDISVTSLIAPAQQRRLMKEHWDEIEEDVSDRMWALFGSSVHYMLEMAGKRLDGALIEHRAMAVIDGLSVSAKIDLLHEGVLSDYKNTSIWAIKDAIENGKSEWTAQLNVQAYLLRQEGHEVNKLQIVAFAKDWRKGESMRYQGYPDKAVIIPIEDWGDEKTKAYIINRLFEHFDNENPVCTSEEMWEKPDTYALMKKGRQSAVKVEASEQEIKTYAANKGLFDPASDEFNGGHYIEVRKGDRVRCADYCGASKFCKQYQDYLGK